MPLTHTDIVKAEEIATKVVNSLGVDLLVEVSGDTVGLKINLVGKDSAIIIGYHGETLSELNYLLGIMIRRQLGKEVSVRVDAGEYLKAKDTKIRELARYAISKVEKSGFPESLAGLNSYERRLVHDEVGKEGLISESEGEGHDRKVIIKPRSN